MATGAVSSSNSYDAYEGSAYAAGDGSFDAAIANAAAEALPEPIILARAEPLPMRPAPVRPAPQRVALPNGQPSTSGAARGFFETYHSVPGVTGDNVWLTSLPSPYNHVTQMQGWFVLSDGKMVSAQQLEAGYAQLLQQLDKVNHNNRHPSNHIEAEAARIDEDGCRKFNGGQVHHVLPVAVYNRSQGFLANELGIPLDMQQNVVRLPVTLEEQEALKVCQGIERPLHGGSHPLYSQAVEDKLIDIRENYTVQKVQRVEKFRADMASASSDAQRNELRAQFDADLSRLQSRARTLVIHMIQKIDYIILGAGGDGMSINHPSVVNEISRVLPSFHL